MYGNSDYKTIQSDFAELKRLRIHWVPEEVRTPKTQTAQPTE